MDITPDGRFMGNTLIRELAFILANILKNCFLISCNFHSYLFFIFDCILKNTPMYSEPAYEYGFTFKNFNTCSWKIDQRMQLKAIGPIIEIKHIRRSLQFIILLAFLSSCHNSETSKWGRLESLLLDKRNFKQQFCNLSI